jgi:hypothetical protein
MLLKFLRKDDFSLDENNIPKHTQLYSKIKKRCAFQERFSLVLLVNFFILQYSLPIALVVLGSITTSQEQIKLFISDRKENLTISEKNKSQEQAISQTDSIVSRIIFLLGIISILLGVTNSTIRPSESYDVAAKYNNKFAQFHYKLEIEMARLIESNASKDKILNFLLQTNDELYHLINEYNQARSLRERRTDIDILKQKIDTLKSESQLGEDKVNDGKSQ